MSEFVFESSMVSLVQYVYNDVNTVMMSSGDIHHRMVINVFFSLNGHFSASVMSARLYATSPDYTRLSSAPEGLFGLRK